MKAQKIINFLQFEHTVSSGFIELENGFIITEQIMAPHGTGMAGLHFYENLADFEKRCGTGYNKLIF